MNDLYVPNEGLLWATAAVVVAALALIAAIWAIRFPRRPKAGPETTELGPETPALANLLTYRFEPTRDAVPATLVDLAARGLVEIEDRGIGRYFCRLKERNAELTPYEALLLEHLRSVATGGVVPAEALTTGPQDRSKAWWKEFRKRLVEHAQAEGLSRDLWGGLERAALLVGAVVVFVMFEIAIGFNAPSDVAPSTAKNVVMILVVTAFPVVSRTVTSTRQTETEEGRRRASRWLGVRRALEESPSFEVLPPSGVVVWERHLAYAAALGAAPRSTRALPMGAESDHEVWLVRDGEWQKVAIRYPRFRPGWGRHPLLALALGTLGSLFGWWLLRLATGEPGGDALWLKIFGAVLLALAILALTRSLPQLLFGFLDLLGSRPVEGTVLRARTRWAPFPYTFQGDGQEYLRFFVALDDGRSRKLTAFRVSPDLYEELPQGSKAALRVTPYLGYVRRRSA